MFGDNLLKNKKCMVGRHNLMPDSMFDKNELAMGIKEEMEEHTDSMELAKDITKDHLVTNPHYYTQMKKMGL